MVELNDPEWPQIDEVRVAELKPLRNGTFFTSLAEGYCSLGEREIAELGEALDRGDFERGAVLAHSLKSSSINIGAQVVGRICYKMEGQLLMGETEGLELLRSELVLNFEKAVRELRALI